MEIYNRSDIERIKERVRKNPSIIEKIEKNTSDVRNKMYIQESGIATWLHYFCCKECGARLIFDYYNNDSFTCSNCGKIHTGEPYLGAWWCQVLDMNLEASFQMAFAYVGTDNKSYLEVAKKILIGYADNYKNYEVHGGIPYNHPGRFCSQVLDDSAALQILACTYALIKNDLTEDEIKHIEEDMFRPASEHQKKYFTRQLHNHEVAICTSIGAIGLAINDESLVEFACNTEYGLKYQIDHAYLDDNLWFECTGGYHNYALRWLMIFEEMAKNTKYSLFRDPHYREKLEKALLYLPNLYLGNNKIVAFNDGGGTFPRSPERYEFAYAVLGNKDLLPIIKTAYYGARREDYIDVLMYGADSLPDEIPDLQPQNYLSAVGSNIAKLHGTDNRYFVLKATPYGGEHDHYDRLSISFDAFNADLSKDFGTSHGYGSPLHYGYYKNTASHNTVVIDGENMAPCATVVNEYRVNAPDDIYLDAETLPPEEFTMPDTFTIKQWSDEAYKGVRMRRIISWHDKYFIDVFSVKSENELKKEWSLHISSEAKIPSNAEYVGKLSDKGAQSYINDAYLVKNGSGVIKSEFKKDDLFTDVYTLCDGCSVIYATGPDNPANKNVAYLLERTNEKCPVYVNVIETHKGISVIASVEASVENGAVSVTVTQRDGKIRRLNVKI